MTKNELKEIAASVSKEVLIRNQENISERIRNMLTEKKTLTLEEALSCVLTYSTVDVSELSAAIAAELLVKLGLVQLEDE